jgi:hypothetical protein
MEDIPTRMEHDLVGDLCVVCTYTYYVLVLLASLLLLDGWMAVLNNAHRKEKKTPER